MRCAECGLYECCMRTPLGGCPNGEKTERVEVITITDTKPISLPNGPRDERHEPTDSTKEPDEYMKKMRNAIVSSWFGDDAELLSAAQDLVDAVERYVEPKPGQEFVHRSEILLKKNVLKELLK